MFSLIHIFSDFLLTLNVRTLTSFLISLGIKFDISFELSAGRPFTGLVAEY